MSINSNFKILVIVFVPIYLAAAYYVYNYHYNNINEIKKFRLNTIGDIQLVEDKMKKEYSKSPSVKKSYTDKDPSKRLGNELISIENELKEIGKIAENFKKKVEKKLEEDLTKLIPKYEKKAEVKPQIEIIDSDAKDDIVGQGPTNDAETNREIAITMHMKERVDQIISQLSSEVPYYRERLDTTLKSFQTVDEAELKKRSDAQWDLLDRISLIEEQISSLNSSLKLFSENNLKFDNKIESLTKSEYDENYVKTVQKLPLFELQSLITAEHSNINILADKLAQAQVSADKDMGVNFINYKDYHTLASHFGKEFKYKKLISTHDKLTKEKFASALSLRSKILIYMELLTGRRVGIYIDIAFPKSTKFPRSFKDPNAFIVYFNNKEFYNANPDTNAQFRTDSDYLLLIGNTKNNDGIWINLPQSELENPVHFGKPTTEYDCMKGSLLTSPIIDRIYSFEVYELDLSN